MEWALRRRGFAMKSTWRFFLFPAVILLLFATLAVPGEESAELKVGDKAPLFDSIDDSGKPWKASDYVGKKILVVYFFPAAMTGG
jgi:peroxiredoxin Q/BCP